MKDLQTLAKDQIIAEKYYFKKGEKIKSINLIIPENDSWILNKFANSVKEELEQMDAKYKVEISTKFNSFFDVNHFFTSDTPTKINNVTTFLITHINTQYQIDEILKATNAGAVGICMSLETRDMLLSSGVKRDKICYINPAQDGQIKPRKIVLGFTHRTYRDFRKRESMLIDVCQCISPEVFKFVIMGAGWEKIIEELNSLSFEVDYYPQFDKDKYNQIITSLDYYCYFGFDEGSMGFMDAVAAGVDTIVTPQGYHLDIKDGITYPVRTVDDIVDVLKTIETKRLKSTKFSNTFTWRLYTKKHLEVWNYLSGGDDLSNILKNKGIYEDGIFSLMLSHFREYTDIPTKLKNKIEKIKKSEK